MQTAASTLPTPPHSATGLDPQSAIDQTERYSAHNYHPLPVVVAKGEGVWVEDVEQRRYLDMLSAYSAVNFGHCPPRLVAAAKAQLDRVTLTSRAFYNDQLGPMCEELTALVGGDMVLPMNSGAEAVETAIKLARKWGVRKKGLPDGAGKVVVCEQNFHGRTTTIISFSQDPAARDDFGPYTPGFVHVPFGDAHSLEAMLAGDSHIVAFLLEPIQGEAGVRVPPTGYLRQVRELCSRHNVLMVADEIQCGLGRTGRTLTCQHEDVQPDLLLLGKALGGGIVPVSAVVGVRSVMEVIQPGQHGSTFGGNPMACAVAREVIKILSDGKLQEHARELGAHMLGRLGHSPPRAVAEVRGMGLWAGVRLHPSFGGARRACEMLLERGILCKETHTHILRLAPPLVIERAELDWAIDTLQAVLATPPAG